MKCEDCKWWEKENEPSCCEFGYCHRLPPTIKDTNVEGGQIFTYKPVYSDGWCGEFEQKDPPFSIEDLGCSVRTRKVLKKMEIRTKAEFLKLTALDVLRQKNAGESTLREIERKQENIHIEI